MSRDYTDNSQLSSHAPIRPLLLMSFLLSVFPSAYHLSFISVLFISPSSFHPSFSPSFHPSIFSSFHPFIFPFFLSSIFPSFHPFILPSFLPSILPSFHPTILLFILLYLIPPHHLYITIALYKNLKKMMKNRKKTKNEKDEIETYVKK